jgi:hypothetical protein
MGPILLVVVLCVLIVCVIVLSGVLRKRDPQISLAISTRPALKPPRGERLAVVGGLGFVGDEIVKQAEAAGYAVTVVDSRLPRPAQARDSIAYIAADIRAPPEALARELSTAGIVSVIHTAGVIPGAGVTREFLFSVNVEGTRNVHTACRLARVSRLVYTSSATVVKPFGSSPVINADESWPFPARHIDAYTGKWESGLYSCSSPSHDAPVCSGVFPSPFESQSPSMPPKISCSRQTPRGEVAVIATKAAWRCALCAPAASSALRTSLRRSASTETLLCSLERGRRYLTLQMSTA